MKRPISKRLARVLAEFDPVEMASAVGALHLVPGNASKPVSLDYWAHAAASVEEVSGSKGVTSASLVEISRKFFYAGSKTDVQNDSCPCLFTEDFIFGGRCFLVLPGSDAQVTSILRWIFDALGSSPEASEYGPLASEVRALALLLLAIQDSAARRAGLATGMPPGDDDREREIEIPREAELRRLSAACRFSRQEIEQIGSDSAASESTLAAVTIHAGDPELLRHSFGEGALQRKPLVAIHGDYVLPEPTAILSALLHRVLALSKEHGALSAIGRWIHERAVSDAVRNALLLGFNLEEVGLLVPDGWASYLFGSCDTDKAVLMFVVTDPLKNFSEGTSIHRWDVRRVQRRINSFKASMVRNLFSRSQHPESILSLWLIQYVRSTVTMAPLASQSAFGHEIAMTVTDLGLVAITHAGDHLLFWRFASHAVSVREKAHVVATSTVDELAMFEIYGWFFGVPADTGFIVLVKPGTALHFHVKRQRDFLPHGTVWFRDGRYVEVWRLTQSDVPAFTPRPPVNECVSVCVESIAVPLWIISKPDLDPSARGFLGDFADAVAYWVWQAADAINDWVEGAEYKKNIVLVLEPAPPDLFERVQSGELEPPTVASGDTGLEWAVDQTAGEITLRFSPRFLFATSTPFNEAERSLVSGFLESVRALLFDVTDDDRIPDDEEVREAVDRIAPLGLKKRMTMIATHQADFAGGPVPEFRRLLETKVAAVTAGAGQRLLERGWRPGKILPSKQTALLNDFVRQLLADIGSLLRTFERGALLAGLVAHHESVMSQFVQHELMAASRLACYAHDPQITHTILNEMSEITHANIACRVLIECAVAEPPLGLRVPSIETYDRLLSLAHQVVELGALSDLLFHGLIETSITLHPFGTLVVDTRAVGEVNARFAREYAHGAFARARRATPEHWPNRAYVDDATMIKALGEQAVFNNAFREEFGISLEQFGRYSRAVLNLGSEIESPTKIVPKAAFDLYITREAELSQATVESLNSLFSLQKRASYFRDDHFAEADIYPWRFNRALSYIRRPLLVTTVQGKEQVVWGNRNFARSMSLLLALSDGGRLKARSGAMKAWITETRKRESAAFEAYVAEVIRRDPSAPVAKRLEKVNGQRLRDESNRDLGDIDVFVALPAASLIVLVECKHLELARSPAEIHSELVELFKGKSSGRSDVAKHMRRVDWVRENLTVLLRENGLDEHLSWTVQPLLVSGIELHSYAFVKDSPMEVVDGSAWSRRRM